MSGSRRGLVAPQNTFLDKIIRRCNGQFYSFVLANARIVDYPIVYCNEGFSRLTGYSRVDIMQKSANCAYFYGEQTSKEMKDRLSTALDSQTPDQIEMLFYKKNRSPIWLLVCVAPVKNDQEEVVLFLLAFRDITPLKTPFDDEESVKGLSKFARLARSVTRNRTAMMQAAMSQGLPSPGIVKHTSHRLLLPNSLDSMRESASPTSPPSHGGSMKLNESIRSDAERGMITSASWLDLVPPYKQETPKTPPHIILHYVAFKTTWDWIILFLTGYTAVMVPFNAAFKSKTMDDVSFLVVDSIVDVIFFIDIVLNFHTTFVGPNGEVISDATIIRINYLKGWFIVDLLSCLPYDVFNAFQPEATQSTISSLFGALKVVRLLRIGRVTRKLDQYLEYMAASLLLMIAGFVLLAHWLACVWYSVGHADLKNGIYYGWIPRLMNDINQSKGSPANWTSATPLPRTMTYVTSLYFTLSLITSIGFGNVSATTFGEKLVSVVFMLIGAFGYATIFGNVTTIFQGMYATRSRYHDMMGSVKDFIKTHSVPKDLAERVIDYVTSTWAITKGIDTAKVLNYCPKDMKADLCIHLNRMVFNEHPAFRLASDGCLRALAVNFTTIHTAPGDLIFHQGESIDQLCFVVAGSLEVIQDEEIVAFLGRGDVFGEPFWKDPNRMSHSAATVRALTYCDLHCIKKDNLLQVLNFYSAFANSFARNLVLTYDLKTRLIFRKLADVKREYELAEHRKNENPLSSLRADHPVRRMIHRFRMIGAHSQSQSDSPGKIITDEAKESSGISESLIKSGADSTVDETSQDPLQPSMSKLDGIASKWSRRISMQRLGLAQDELEKLTSPAVEKNDLNRTPKKLSSHWSKLAHPSTIKEEPEKEIISTPKKMSEKCQESCDQIHSCLCEKRLKHLEDSNQRILQYVSQVQSEISQSFQELLKRIDRVDTRLEAALRKTSIRSTEQIDSVRPSKPFRHLRLASLNRIYPVNFDHNVRSGTQPKQHPLGDRISRYYGQSSSDVSHSSLSTDTSYNNTSKAYNQTGAKSMDATQFEIIPTKNVKQRIADPLLQKQSYQQSLDLQNVHISFRDIDSGSDSSGKNKRDSCRPNESYLAPSFSTRDSFSRLSTKKEMSISTHKFDQTADLDIPTIDLTRSQRPASEFH